MSLAVKLQLLGNVLGVVLASWAWLWPTPYVPIVAALAILPVIAWLATMATGNVLMVDPKGGQTGPAYSFMFFGPLLALGLRGFDVAVLDPGLAIGLTLLGGVLITAALAFTAVRITRPQMLLLLLGFSLWFSWGLVAQADSLFDRGPSEFVWANVLYREQTHSGRRSHNYLTLTGDGLEDLPSRVDVEDRFFATVHEGERICFQVHPGLLRIRWQEIGYCPAKYLTDRDITAQPTP